MENAFLIKKNIKRIRLNQFYNFIYQIKEIQLNVYHVFSRIN